MTSIRNRITELNGYLNAISDLNDQVGHRYGYYAGYKKTGGLDPAAYIREIFGEQAFINLIESGLRKEASLIKSYVLCNVPNADLLNAQTRRPGLTETITGRIQECLIFDVYYNEKTEHRWVSSFSLRGCSCEAIFVATTNYLTWVVFSNWYD